MKENLSLIVMDYLFLISNVKTCRIHDQEEGRR